MKEWRYYQISDDGDFKNWADAIKYMCTVKSAPELLYTLDECRRNGLASMNELCFFKNAIKPMWEDPANINGGRCILEISSNDMDLAINCWKKIVALCFVGDIEAINGCIFSEKSMHYRIGVWIADESSQNEVAGAMKEVIGGGRISYSYTSHSSQSGGNFYKKRGASTMFGRNK